ncbi:recombinase family protein [Parvularcula maris]|uniref:recombinase family protein n=1 Tax=Parvularcula maris TaxID=2965077 RepID=UPI00351A6FE3
MDGYLPAGYAADGRILRVHQDEAETVRLLLGRTLEFSTIPPLKADCNARGMASPKLLSNPIYRGQIRHTDQVHKGQHEAIINEALFDQVQQRLARRGGKHRTRSQESLPLLGKLYDKEGTPLVATRAMRDSQRYRLCEREPQTARPNDREARRTQNLTLPWRRALHRRCVPPARQ